MYFWLLLLAHGTADFIFQPDAVSAAKCRNQWQGYALHGLAIFGCTWAAVHFFGWRQARAAAAAVTGIHLLLDWLKNLGRTVLAQVLKRPERPGLPGLLLDQALHIYTLLWVWRIWDRPVHAPAARFYAGVFAPVQIDLVSWGKILPVLTVYVFVAFGGAVLVRMGLDQLLPGPGRNEAGRKPAGKYIGILERILILTLTVTGHISAIGFVFAAKSIARFSELSDRDFAEYYLVGSLLSFFLALAGGLALSWWLNNAGIG